MTTHFSKQVLDWYEIHGRKDLPWQLNKTPYRVWLSEIMLQQTQVVTVINYFKRFVHTFPDVESLAKASEDEVLHLWTGLGYYARARNLHKCAKAVMSDFGGKFPDNQTDLESLSGIGRSTAAAIISLAFEKPATILDGNVKRVLTRYKMVEGWPGNKKVENELWELAENLTPKTDNAEYTQAMMDLGATLCKRSKPRCEECPVKQDCFARLESRQKEFPNSKPKKDKPTKSTFMLIQLDKLGRIRLIKRPSKGIWAGLYSFPEYEKIDDIEKLMGSDNHKLGSFKHTFSHYHLQVHPVVVKGCDSNEVRSDDNEIWYHPEVTEEIGLNAVVLKVFKKLKDI
ncbi:A/G-specific adenine glycosylase [Marinicellulosiphila megalodicopiae]|uniref:A/G-specific adenine glycosylase n=1 Tax=Marinicellulosiphila megalodicopiae TaxID=2724896 RepID=UPI003BAE4686